MLTRQRQFGIKKEAVEGTAETLTATEYAGNLKKIDPPEMDIPAYERELMRGSLSKDTVLKAVRSMGHKVTYELAGGTASVATPWHDALEACGLAKAGLKVVTAGAQAGGTFTPGDAIGDNTVQGSATKTGILIKFIPGSPGKIVYLPLVGAFVDTDTMYNYASPQVSSTVDSAPAAAGWCWRPKSETAAAIPPSATTEVRDGEQLHRIIGARGMVTFNIAHNAPVLMDFEFKGPMDTASDLIHTGGFMTGIAAITATPVMGKGFPILFDAYGPILTQLTLKIDNTLALRPNIGQTMVSESGYMACRITDRKISVTSDPEHPPVATLSWLNQALAGTTQRLYVQAGFFAAGAAAGTVVIIGPKLQITGNPGLGDRDGIVIDNLDMQLAWSGTDDDELILAHVFV